MAPFQPIGLTSIIITLITGFFFGLVLESAGFGIARNLAAQFYFYDMRVLKVMFTAIITAMLLIFFCTTVGLLDFNQLGLPSTHLGPNIIGGLALGFGFIFGGYCPGTSLVSSSTFRIDGMFFVGGVALGIVIFGALSPWYYGFWMGGGFAARLTLMDITGLDAGVLVFAVFVMAIGAFGCAEIMERIFQRDDQPLPKETQRTRTFRWAAVTVGTILALITLVVGQPTPDKLVAWKQVELGTRIENREVYIDPAELLGLMYNKQVQRVLLDVRDEADYNMFHVRDAQHVTMPDLDGDWVKKIPVEAIVVVMSNDEKRATEAWKKLAVRENVNAYILAGGVNRWLDIYADGDANVPDSNHAPATDDDTPRHRFNEALGARFPCARPNRYPVDTPTMSTMTAAVAGRKFKAKIKLKTAVRKESGGCG